MAKSKRNLKPIPKFATEAVERRFWETHDSADYVDWSNATVVSLPNLKPSTETISLRLPAPLLSDLKALANKRDVPYQSLLKVFVADRVAEEWRSSKEWGAVSSQRRSRRAAGDRRPRSSASRVRFAAEAGVGPRDERQGRSRGRRCRPPHVSGLTRSGSTPGSGSRPC